MSRFDSAESFDKTSIVDGPNLIDQDIGYLREASLAF